MKKAAALFRRVRPSEGHPSTTPVTLDSWNLPETGGTRIERRLALALVEEARLRGIRQGNVITATVNVSPLVNKIDPDSGRFVNGAWHVTRPADVLHAVESEILPHALKLIRDGQLAIDGLLSVEPYVAQTVPSERLGKLFEIVTTGHRFLVSVMIEEAS